MRVENIVDPNLHEVEPRTCPTFVQVFSTDFVGEIPSIMVSGSKRARPIYTALHSRALGKHRALKLKPDAVKQRLLAFQTRYETMAQPFEWKFTRHDLARLLNKFRSQPDSLLRIAA